jgi:hypothetical protein
VTELESLYQAGLAEPTDIVEHMPLLREYAGRCRHVTEFGVRRGMSTRALAMGLPAVLRSYDIRACPEGENVIAAAVGAGIDALMLKEDTKACDYEPTDLLFIDTIHTEAQVAAELARADEKVARWLIFHDTETNGEKGEDGGAGILAPIRKFLATYPHWLIERDEDACNGLMVLVNQHCWTSEIGNVSVFGKSKA